VEVCPNQFYRWNGAMSRRIDWRKTGKNRISEDKFAGSIKADGVRVIGPRQDSLARRAEAEAVKWAKTLSTKDRLSVPPPSVHDWSARKAAQRLERKRR
jgi:hypothetical protein